MRRIFQWIIATIVTVLLLGTIARADQSTSTRSQPVPSGAKKPAAQKNAAAPKKQEVHKLKPVVVTATKIEQPLDEIGTTVTVVDNSQVEAQKIDRVVRDRHFDSRRECGADPDPRRWSRS